MIPLVSTDPTNESIVTKKVNRAKVIVSKGLRISDVEVAYGMTPCARTLLPGYSHSSAGNCLNFRSARSRGGSCMIKRNYSLLIKS